MTYPPPTLIKRRSRAAWVRYIVLLLVVAIVLGTCTASRFMSSKKTAPETAAADTASVTDDPDAVVETPVAPSGVTDAAPVATNEAVTQVAEAPAAAPVADSPPVATSPAGDARQANRWYYVGALGDGPGAIYSRTGGQWDYALACLLPARAIELMAVNTGNPGGYDQQSMTAGGTTRPVDATYSRDGGGTISMRVPARDAFFDRLTNGATLELQLLASRRVMLPVGPEVVRLVRTCRGN